MKPEHKANKAKTQEGHSEMMDEMSRLSSDVSASPETKLMHSSTYSTSRTQNG